MASTMEKFMNSTRSFALPVILIMVATPSAAISVLKLAILKASPLKVLDSRNWREESFARYWKYIAPLAASPISELVQLTAKVKGTVVDIGTGTGTQLHYYKSHADEIEHIYFIEPCVTLHPQLEAHAVAAGLDGKFTIITCGAEDILPELEKRDVKSGTVDFVVSIMCLCGVPNVERSVAKVLYDVLRPRGQLIIFEHVKADQSTFGSIYQTLLQFVWPQLLGGCQLTQKTDEYLRRAGPWKKVEVARATNEAFASPIPFMVGSFTK